MSHPEEYDVVVLGSGAGGKFIAWSLTHPTMAEGRDELFQAVKSTNDATLR